MGFSTAAKNAMLDALDPDTISLHSGDPGASGTANEISGGGYSRQAAVFDAASSGERLLNDDVDFSATAAQSITHIGIWDGATFVGSDDLTGDVTANADGEFTVKGTVTKLSIS